MANEALAAAVCAASGRMGPGNAKHPGRAAYQGATSALTNTTFMGLAAVPNEPLPKAAVAVER